MVHWSSQRMEVEAAVEGSCWQGVRQLVGVRLALLGVERRCCCKYGATLLLCVVHRTSLVVGGR